MQPSRGGAQQQANSASRMNQLQLREQQQLNRERRREEDYQEEQHQQLVARQRAKYDHVQSHGYGPSGAPQQENNFNRGGGGGGAVDDVEIKVTVRSCDQDGHSYAFRESEALGGGRGSEQGPRRGGNVPQQQQPQGARRASGGAQQQQQDQVMFGRRAGQPTPPSSASSQPGSAGGGAHARGAVPQYLVQRKAQMKAEKDAIDEEVARQKVESQYPPGHRPVGEEERQAILTTLAARKKELEGELGKLPMRFDTQHVKLRRQAIEGEMAEVEAAQQKFSVKKQLYVPI